jgi:TPR repeat protein
LYFEGKGLRKSTRLALGGYSRAAEKRDELALIQLGNMYEKGLGTEVDTQRWAVRNGIPAAEATAFNGRSSSR